MERIIIKSSARVEAFICPSLSKSTKMYVERNFIFIAYKCFSSDLHGKTTHPQYLNIIPRTFHIYIKILNVKEQAWQNNLGLFSTTKRYFVGCLYLSIAHREQNKINKHVNKIP